MKLMNLLHLDSMSRSKREASSPAVSVMNTPATWCSVSANVLPGFLVSTGHSVRESHQRWRIFSTIPSSRSCKHGKNSLDTWRSYLHRSASSGLVPPPPTPSSPQTWLVRSDVLESTIVYGVLNPPEDMVSETGVARWRVKSVWGDDE